MKLRILRSVLLITITTFLLASCQKEVSLQDLTNPQPVGGGGGTSGQITGDWDFVGIAADTKSTVIASTGGVELKAVTTSNYISQNNTGSAKITPTQFIFSGLSYSIDTVMHVKTYMNGLLMDESDLPYVMSAPVTDKTMDYTRNNNDSLTFANGFIVFTAPTSATGPTTGPVGASINWSGDTLLLKVVSSFTTSITQAGTPAIFEGAMSGVIKLKRK